MGCNGGLSGPREEQIQSHRRVEKQGEWSMWPEKMRIKDKAGDMDGREIMRGLGGPHFYCLTHMGDYFLHLSHTCYC